MLPRVSAKSASYLTWLHVLLKLIDLPFLPDRLTVHCVLEAFDHGFEMLEAFLQGLKTLRYRRVLLAGVGRDARWLSTQAESNHHAFKYPW
jgi:hypothetical protein